MTFDPTMLDVKPFVRYDPETGKIIDAGMQGLWFTRNDFNNGEAIIAAPFEIKDPKEVDQYVDCNRVSPCVITRPKMFLKPSTLTPLPAQEVVISGVPACTVRFSGPISGTQKHDGKSDMKIGWTVPGNYVLTFDPWPYMPETLTITVGAPVQAQVQVQGKLT